MGVGYESQVYAVCDICGDSECSSMYRLAEFKELLRAKGWTIGKKTICPACNKKRVKGRKNDG